MHTDVIRRCYNGAEEKILGVCFLGGLSCS